MELETRKVSESMVETVHLVRPNHLNASGRLFGGVLMQWIDEVGGVVGKRHAHKNVTTVSVDNLNFLRGAYSKDTLVLQGKVTYVGNTSMEVKVESYVENINAERVLMNRAYITLVALDENDKPTPIAKLELETDEEREEWQKAQLRREIRMMQADKDLQ
jgi:acyl-CoA hydrolase